MIPDGLAAVVLAAGRSSRMAGAHKLLETLDGRPVVSHAVRAALAAGLRPVVVVTGHRAEEVEAVLPEGATPVRNPAHAEGLASSLAAGLRALPPGTRGAFVALGDMPLVRAAHYSALAHAWRPDAIVVPVRGGRRANPVLWSARYFDEMTGLTGDRGAKQLLEAHTDAVVEVEAADDAVLVDVDEAEDLERLRQGR